MTTLQPVEVHQDNDGHWYVLPKEKVDRFHFLLEEAERTDDHNDFIDEFSEYMTGGSINLIQLYAEL